MRREHENLCHKKRTMREENRKTQGYKEKDEVRRKREHKITRKGGRSEERTRELKGRRRKRCKKRTHECKGKRRARREKRTQELKAETENGARREHENTKVYQKRTM